MKQIDECLTRAYDRKHPLASKKWKAIIEDRHNDLGELLYLYHYHHLILVYHIEADQYLYEWWEKPADKRGLVSAKCWLKERKLNQRELKEDCS